MKRPGNGNVTHSMLLSNVWAKNFGVSFCRLALLLKRISFFLFCFVLFLLLFYCCCCLGILFSSPIDGLAREGKVFSLWFTFQAVRLVADLCLDNNIHDPQLWNSVLQQLLTFRMVSSHIRNRFQCSLCDVTTSVCFFIFIITVYFFFRFLN